MNVGSDTFPFLINKHKFLHIGLVLLEIFFFSHLHLMVIITDNF